MVTTDGSGIATFLETLPVAVESGEGITATATDPVGRTSEFSQRLILAMDPRSGPAEGGTPVTISGMDFGAGTVVTVAGLPVGSLQVIDYATLTGVMPALSAGAVYDVVLSNPPQGGYSLVSGWLSDFLDVPSGNAFHDFVARAATNGISAGVGAGLFGIDNPTTRQQMAVFIMKAKRGVCYVPPPCAGLFPDVPCSSVFAPWVEALAGEGITSGCGGGNFCPQTPVRRDQMAVFLLKGLLGPGYVPRRVPASSSTWRARRRSPTGSKRCTRQTSPEAAVRPSTALAAPSRADRWRSSSRRRFICTDLNGETTGQGRARDRRPPARFELPPEQLAFDRSEISD